jgi:D-alanine-D-alanine ligase
MSTLSIGLVYETFETYPRSPRDAPDSHVEYEPETTIEALEEAIALLGHRARRLGSPLDLLSRLDGSRLLGVDAVFNLAEGFGGRNREAWAPVLLEMADVPTLGSDALTLSLTLDKAWANRWARAGGIPVAPQMTLASPEEAETAQLPAAFPLFVKPRWEGTAKGIRRSSRVGSRRELVAEVARVRSDYDQPALVEAFVPGAEYTVTLVGNDPPVVLPAIQRALERESGIGLHALEGPGAGEDAPVLDHFTPGVLEPELERRLATLSLAAFGLFECRDFARLDFRLDAEGNPLFLEINPLPTFARDGTFAILAELEGCSLAAMLGRCIPVGLARHGLVDPVRAARRAGSGSDEVGSENE